MKVTLDAHTIQIVNLFQNMTGTSVIDCIPETDEIYFVVAKGQYGLAIGKNGSRIRLAERVFKKSIKIFEYSSDPDEFIKNITGSNEIRKKDSNENLFIIDVQQGSRARIIGKNGKNIKVINRFLERLFNIKAGLKMKDDTLPERFLSQPLNEGHSKGISVPLNSLLDGYYRIRKWDENGIPTKEKLAELELEGEGL